MQFPNGRQGENFKINLKSPTTLKSVTPNGQSGNGGSGSNGNGIGNVLPNVTSTNPKTPSPSTNDVSIIALFKYFVFEQLRIYEISFYVYEIYVFYFEINRPQKISLNQLIKFVMIR